MRENVAVINTRKANLLIFIFYARERPTVCVTGLVGGTLTRSTGRKNFGTLKILKKPHRTHKSSARFVGRVTIYFVLCF